MSAPGPELAIQAVAALLETRSFLARLSDPAQTPRVPHSLRREARALLRHYPREERLRPVLTGAESLNETRKTSSHKPFGPG
jgi:hypothetical protein